MKNRLHLFSWILLVFPFVVSCGGGDDDSGSSEIGKIAFTSYTEDDNHEIYVMDADGDHQENISNHSSWDTSPSWSPDKTQIAFVSRRGGSWQIYLMDADGGNQRNISNSSSWDNEPSWSPNGNQIAFVSGRAGHAQIYVMDANGNNQQNITNNSSADDSPAWKP